MMLDLPLPFGPIIHEKRCTDKGQSDLQRERNPAQPHHPFKAQLLLLRAEGLRAELLLPKVKSESKPPHLSSAFPAAQAKFHAQPRKSLVGTKKYSLASNTALKVLQQTKSREKESFSKLC